MLKKAFLQCLKDESIFLKKEVLPDEHDVALLGHPVQDLL